MNFTREPNKTFGFWSKTQLLLVQPRRHLYFLISVCTGLFPPSALRLVLPASPNLSQVRWFYPGRTPEKSSAFWLPSVYPSYRAASHNYYERQEELREDFGWDTRWRSWLIFSQTGRQKYKSQLKYVCSCFVSPEVVEGYVKPAGLLRGGKFVSDSATALRKPPPLPSPPAHPHTICMPDFSQLFFLFSLTPTSQISQRWEGEGGLIAFLKKKKKLGS